MEEKGLTLGLLQEEKFSFNLYLIVGIERISSPFKNALKISIKKGFYHKAKYSIPLWTILIFPMENSPMYLFSYFL